MKIYRIKSRTEPGKSYEIRYFPEADKFVCSCPSYAFSKSGFECKHIIRTRQYLAQKGKVPMNLPEAKKELIIKTEKQYVKIKIEVGKIARAIGENWSDKKLKNEVYKYQKLTEDILAYEMEHDMLPI